MVRKSDTMAISDKPMRNPRNGGQSYNVDVRPIDNGYIRRECRYGDDGSYSVKESYTPDRPSLDMSAPPDKAGSTLMAAAIKTINK